jgi:hypothetical protein
MSISVELVASIFRVLCCLIPTGQFLDLLFNPEDVEIHSSKTLAKFR